MGQSYTTLTFEYKYTACFMEWRDSIVYKLHISEETHLYMSKITVGSELKEKENWCFFLFIFSTERVDDPSKQRHHLSCELWLSHDDILGRPKHLIFADWAGLFHKKKKKKHVKLCYTKPQYISS